MAKNGGSYILKYKDGQYVSVSSTSGTDIYLTTELERAKRFKKFFEANNFRVKITTLHPADFAVGDTPV